MFKLLNIFKKKAHCTIISTPRGYVVCKGYQGSDKSLVLKSFEEPETHLYSQEYRLRLRSLKRLAIEYAHQEIEKEGR